jgi:4-carboxymuconolactone decarboxylase
MSRVPPIDSAALSPEDRRIFDAIRGRRNGVGGPFAAWFVIPEIADCVNQLVERLRFDSELDKRVYELITLVVAAEWAAAFIWEGHEKAALAAGVNPAAVEALAKREVPAFERDDERLAYELTQALQKEHTFSEELFERGRALFGMRGLVELVAVVGYYTMNAMAVRAFDIQREPK